MRNILYALCLLQTGAIVYLLSIMIAHPYDSSNMAGAYLQGCRLGSFMSNDKVVFQKCTIYSTIYGMTLDKLERQDER